VDAGFVVVACGGGGIPIIEESGHAVGVEAVIDKDLAGQRLATLIGANILVILTDVEGAYVNYGKPNQELIREITSGKLRNYSREGQFKEGSMAPKVEAAIRFVESGGERAIIAALGNLIEALDNRAGTQVTVPKI
jgi:carbamate kinase